MRPWRREAIVGGGFEIGSFLSLCGFLLVIGLWVRSALPMLGTFAAFSGGSLPGPDAGIELLLTPTGGNSITGLDSMTRPNPTSTPIPVNVTVNMPTQQPVTVNVVMPTERPEGPATSAETWESEAVIKSWQLPPLGQVPLPSRAGQVVKIKLSYYWPPFGGINCDTDLITGKPECIKMANGAPFYNHIGQAAACPEVMPFGTIIAFEGYAFECLDRGGAIVQDGDAYWIDVLYPWLPQGFWWGRQIDTAVVYLPEG